MDGGLREQKKARTRQRLVQVALSLFVADQSAAPAVAEPRTGAG
jgi:hypothetical protein